MSTGENGDPVGDEPGALEDATEVSTHEPTFVHEGIASRSSRPLAGARTTRRATEQLAAIERFGRFEILGRLAFGGMAEVFLGRERTPLGPSRLVAIKRILPHVANDDHFVGMFLDEARLAIQLNHPNICHLYEFGEIDGSYFIAMEWVHGAPLSRIIQRARAHGGLPVESAVRIVADIAAALAYAHDACDAAGVRLDIVHRDVNPQNIMVSFDGHVKLLDFGVARAASHATRTQAGALKGKLAYMAPEQYRGLELDHRVDLFALGICLWEAISGQLLFRRDHDLDTMKAVVEDEAPKLTEVREGMPRELSAIVDRALAKDRDRRFQTAGELQAALEGWLARSQRFVNATRIAEVMHRLYADEIAGGPVIERTPLGPSHRPSRRSPAGGPANRCYGREEDLDAIRQRLDGGRRIVTLIGPAGVGKTRVARELIALERARESGWPSWFCDLSETRTAADVGAALVHTLDIKGAPDSGPALLARVGRHLARLGDALIVLDNFEQVVERAAETVGAWSEAAPAVRFVITSRIRLSLDTEALHTIAPLGADAAAALWQDRVELAMPGYRVAPDEDAVLRDILAELDHLPLAIELAAARMRIMGLQDVRERLAQRLELLSAGPESGSPARRSLEAALIWSWRHLEDHERVALGQLLVFRGGFDLEAALAVIDLSAFPHAPPPLDVIHALVDESLVVVGSLPDRERRFSLLLSIRDFVASRNDPPPDPTAGDRHAAHFVERAERWVAHWEARSDERALPVLQRERDNLWAAATRADGDPLLALHAALASQPVAGAWGPIRPQLERVSECLRAAGRVGPIPPDLEARALLVRGRLQITNRGLPAAEADWRRAHELAAAAGDRTLEGRARHGIATVAHVRGAIAEARAGYEEAIALLRGQPHRRALARALLDASMLHEITGDVESALDRVEEARVAAGSVRDDLSAAVLASEGSVNLELGDLATARESLEQAVHITRERGYRLLEGQHMGDLALITMLEGRIDEAMEELGDAIEILEEVDDERMVCLFGGYRAAAHHLAGRLREAGPAYEEARRAAAQLGFAHFERYVSLLRVMARADRGRVRSASEALSRIVAQVDPTTDPVSAVVADLARAQIDLANARADRDAGRTEWALAWLSAADSIADERSAAGDTTSNRDTRIARLLFERARRLTTAGLEAPPS